MYSLGVGGKEPKTADSLGPEPKLFSVTGLNGVLRLRTRVGMNISLMMIQRKPHPKSFKAMGQNPVPPVNILIPTRLKWVVHLSKKGTIGFEPWPFEKPTCSLLETQ